MTNVGGTQIKDSHSSGERMVRREASWVGTMDSCKMDMSLFYKYSTLIIETGWMS